MGEDFDKLRDFRRFAVLHPGLTDDWMPGLAQLRNLKSLSLQGAGITDAGLAQLSHLEIIDLRIDQTKVTDAAIPTLKKFPKLRGVNMSPEFSAAGRAELEAFLKTRAP